MVDKSFLIDSRVRKGGKFSEQVDLIVREILDGNHLRLHCIDDDYAQKFTKAVDDKLKSMGIEL